MTAVWGVSIATIVFAGLLLALVSRYLLIWIQAYLTGTQIRFLSLVAMSLRGVEPKVIVQSKVMAVQAGLKHFATREIEALYLAGGDVHRVTLALIAAQRAGIELDWNTAATVDLAGRDILEAVQDCVDPKVIDCPDPAAGRGNTLSGVARDGIQLLVRVRVTVRTNLSQLIGGATESTIIARVGEGIVSSIGSCECYRNALADPLVITRQVLRKGLDSQTAFAIVSIDIADISVGENIGAKLQSDGAEAEIRIARAHAEQRRAMAIAREQEMVALTQENQATVVLAEACIPAAVATAFRDGQLGAGRTTQRHGGSSENTRRLSIPMRRQIAGVGALRQSTRAVGFRENKDDIPATQS
jgi:uncharacterized protein YqfA (UPF0365 family)